MSPLPLVRPRRAARFALILAVVPLTAGLAWPVDRSRKYVFGCSGGGVLTAWVSWFERWGGPATATDGEGEGR
jgi:hypothetical protein